MTPARLHLGLALLLAGALHAPGAARAQSGPGSGTVSLPGATGEPAAGSSQTCVQVDIQGVKPNPYDCLNQQLQQQSQGTSQTQPNLPVTASSPSNVVGTFNEQGLREQYGSNFGKSVVPYRPPAPTFANPVHP